MTALYLALPTTQPLLQAFDELLLLKRGGETIFNGQLGKDSSELIEYFQVTCVATWSECITSAPAADILPSPCFIRKFSGKRHVWLLAIVATQAVMEASSHPLVFSACLLVALHWSGCTGHLSMPFCSRSLRPAPQRLKCCPSPDAESC